MLIFAIGSFIATRAWFSRKRELAAQEGRAGERGVSNVVYAGLIGVAIAIASAANVNFNIAGFNFFELFAISFAVTNSDTFASEIGAIDSKTRLITTLKRVAPGTNGGISLTGTVAAVLGAVIIGISFTYLAYDSFRLDHVILVSSLGFMGNLVDSLLGATLERKGKMSKGAVNLVSALIAVLVGIIILVY